MKNANKKKHFDIAYCIFVAMAFAAVTIWEIFNLPLPQWLITKLSLSDSSFVILQIQVTIAVLPLAIIALITGISKDSLYGVPVIKYAMYLRPVLLNYRRIAIIQMFVIIASFICTSFEMYNHLELCFFITISNSTIMMLDCFSLLSDSQCYKSEIRFYLVNEPTSEKFAALANDIVKSRNEISTDDLKDNLSVLNEMLLVASSKDSTYRSIKSEYIKCTTTLFSSKESDIFLCAADSLQEMYHEFNSKKIKSHLFTPIHFEFYSGIKYLNLSDTHKRGVLDKLRFELFQNSAYSSTYELCSFTA